MKRISLLVLLLVAGCGGGASTQTVTTTQTVTHTATAPAPATASRGCRIHGTSVAVAPTRTSGCTPGMWISDPAIKSTPAAAQYDPDTSFAHVCTKGYNPRPGIDISGAIKRQALSSYGMPATDAAQVEADHLYPRWLGGASVIQNIWPEQNYAHPSGYDHNPKDVLEFAIYKLTCEQHKLTVAQARALFRTDWRIAYKKYVAPTITDH